MTIQISRRGKKYMETAQTLIRIANTMTDAWVASQLNALAGDYQMRAVTASHADAARALALSAGKEEQNWNS